MLPRLIVDRKVKEETDHRKCQNGKPEMQKKEKSSKIKNGRQKGILCIINSLEVLIVVVLVFAVVIAIVVFCSCNSFN